MPRTHPVFDDLRDALRYIEQNSLRLVEQISTKGGFRLNVRSRRTGHATTVRVNPAPAPLEDE